MPTFKDIGAPSQTSTTTLALAQPALAAGDYAVAVILAPNGGSPSGSGWAEADEYDIGNGFSLYALWKKAASGESAGAVNVTVPSGSAVGRCAVYEDAGDGAPDTALSHNASASWVTFPAPDQAGVWYTAGMIFAARALAGTAILTTGTITQSSTVEAYDDLSGYRYFAVDSVVTVAGGGIIRLDFSGSNATSDCVSILIPEPVLGPPEGQFAGSYTVGPGTATGDAPSSGAGFAGSYAFAGAASGGRESTAGFAGAYGYGPGAAVGPLAPWDLLDPPTVTLAGSATLGTTLIAVTDSRLVKIGGATAGLTSVDDGYHRAPFMADTGSPSGGNPRMVPPWGVRFRTDADVIEVAFRTRADLQNAGNNQMWQNIRVKINGQWTRLLGGYLLTDSPYWGLQTIVPEFTQDEPIFIRLEFPSAVVREIQFECAAELAGIRVNGEVTDGTPVGVTLVTVGDSLTGGIYHGTGDGRTTLTSPDGNRAYATYTNTSAWPFYAGQSLGIDNVVNLGVGGSGFLDSGDTVPYGNAGRVDDVTAASPDIITVGTYGNDMDDYTSGQVGTAADAAFAALVADNPGVPIFTYGITSAFGEGIAAYNAALQAAAENNGVWFSDLQGTLYAPDGEVFATGLPDVWDTFLDHLSDDNQHPSQEGQRLFGVDMAEYLAVIMAAPPEGQFAGTYGYAGTAAGGRDSEAGFAGAYSYSGAAEGERPSEAGFTGVYGYGPGTATGTADHTGGFTGAYGYGGTADGGRTSEGGFTGTVSFGPAEGGGETTHEAGFAGAYSYSGAAEGERPSEAGFAGVYGYGPGTATGTADHTGGFTGTVSFGPAEGGGETTHEGGFAGTVSFGPGTASGQSQAGATFTGAYSFGPTTAAGDTDHTGEFTGVYSHGPATAAGESPHGGTFTGAYSYAGTASGPTGAGFHGDILFGPGTFEAHTDTTGTFAGTTAWGPGIARGWTEARFPTNPTLVLHIPQHTLGLVIPQHTLGLVIPTRTLEWSHHE